MGYSSIRTRKSRRLVGLFGLTLALGIATAPAVFAQPQSDAQSKCLTGLAKGAAKLAKTQGKVTDRCVYELALNGGNAESCSGADPKGKIAKAAQKLIDAEAKHCGERPDFGFVGAAELITATTAHRTGLVETTTGISRMTAADANCGRHYLKGMAKIFGKKLGLFARCLKLGLADASIQSSSDIDACFSSFDGSSEPKIAKALASLAAKIAKLGCDMPTFLCFDTVEQCADQVTSCHGCQMLRIGGDLTVDCEVVGGGGTLACASICGDGEVGVGTTGFGTEECDDGNRVNGDGCDSDCTITGCGNGITTPGEYCDTTYGSIYGGICVGGTDNGSNCAWNDECTGGYCTSCPFRQRCLADCSACAEPPLCVLYTSQGCQMLTGTCIGQVCVFLPIVACDDAQCDTPGNCTINGYCVPTSEEECAEYEGVLGSCTLGY